MLAASRRAMIKEMLLEKKTLKVSELSEIFNVSDETIRRDLKKLEEEGIIEKNYGGAVLRESTMIVPPISQRSKEHIREKEKIACEAIKRVKDGMTVVLDTGTTTQQVAKLLKAFKELTIITNGLNILNEMSSSAHINLFSVGGKLKSSNFSLVGPEAERNMRLYSADIAFIATSGISWERGLTTSDIFEAEVKKAMIDSAKKVIVVADSSKFLKDAMVSFCGLNKIDEIITSGEINQLILENLSQHGVKITLV